MLVAIMILLIIADLGIFLTMLMVAALVSRKPKSIEEAQADLFEAWGDSIIEECKK